jgi:hypothetical protein
VSEEDRIVRWSAFLVEETELSELHNVPESSIFAHAEAVSEQRLHSKQLYGRWERQHWLAEDIELGPDHDHWNTRLPHHVREPLRLLIQTFIVGEYTGLELLGPIFASCPHEDDLLYLGTQVSDESRHTVLMSRIADEVFGLGPDLSLLLPQAWEEMSPAYRALSSMESALIRELAANPNDYGCWLRAVTLFHLITEGMLALDSQRALIKGLARVSFLPGVRTGFVAMTRDESRHVSYGMNALRRGVAEGYADAICDVLERALPLAVHLDAPADDPASTRDHADRWAAADRTAARMRLLGRRRMTLLDLPQRFIEDVIKRSGAVPTGITSQLAPRPQLAARLSRTHQDLRDTA